MISISLLLLLVQSLGLLLPLLTANAELYLFVSLATWFFAGYIESRYTQLKFEKNKSLY